MAYEHSTSFISTSIIILTRLLEYRQYGNPVENMTGTLYNLNCDYDE